MHLALLLCDVLMHIILLSLILAYNHSTLTQPCCVHGRMTVVTCVVNTWISPKIELLYDVMVMRLGVLSSSHTKPHMQMKTRPAAAGSHYCAGWSADQSDTGVSTRNSF